MRVCVCARAHAYVHMCVCTTYGMHKRTYLCVHSYICTHTQMCIPIQDVCELCYVRYLYSTYMESNGNLIASPHCSFTHCTISFTKTRWLKEAISYNETTPTYLLIFLPIRLRQFQLDSELHRCPWQPDTLCVQT